MGSDRRNFIRTLSASSLVASGVCLSGWKSRAFGDEQQSDSRRTRSETLDELPEPLEGESLIQYILRLRGEWDWRLYKSLLGAANEFKEGDKIVGVAASNDAHRQLARRLLNHTRLEEIDSHPPLRDDLYSAIQSSIPSEVRQKSAKWTFQEFKDFLLTADESQIRDILPGLSSDVIGCLVKLMTDDELKAIGSKVFHPLPGSQIGAKGYLGARIQPNSPTDNVEDIRWQVLCGWSYAVGDVLLGTNPVSSEVESVAAVQFALRDLLETFGLTGILPHCVLAHIDVQAATEQRYPGSTALWFQSIAGSDSANATFDISLDRMLQYARAKGGPFGLYFETGQGADFTNGHDHGFDMVLHESRKYGFARFLSSEYAKSHSEKKGELSANSETSVTIQSPWVHLNDVAGFIGPEVFRTREQLVRCCLEDIVMGKLHELCIGLDVCSTLHMDVSLDDLDWCLDQLAEAGPAYLMALPTKIDPMLGYLTTGFQDHVRLRQKYGTRVNDAMWDFFKQLDIINSDGQPTDHFGDPLWVYLQYRRKKKDDRPAAEILAEGERQMNEVRQRGVFLASGFGQNPSEVRPDLSADIRRIYEDSKQSIWAELDDGFEASYEPAIALTTNSTSRENYILHPASGEQLSIASVELLRELQEKHSGRFDVQIVVSDGLNALALTDKNQLEPFLSQLRLRLKQQGYRPAPEIIVIRSGRVRAGYHVGELLFGATEGTRGIIHVIGERPGSGHRTFSAYFTCADATTWGSSGQIDHDRTRVVAGIANTALAPQKAAEDVVRILGEIWGKD